MRKLGIIAIMSCKIGIKATIGVSLTEIDYRISGLWKKGSLL